MKSVAWGNHLGCHRGKRDARPTPGKTGECRPYATRQARRAGFMPADGGRPRNGRQDAEPFREHSRPGSCQPTEVGQGTVGTTPSRSVNTASQYLP